jgi:WD40 repeat protein
MMYSIRVGHGLSLWDVVTGNERPIEASSVMNLTFLEGGKTLACANGRSYALRDESVRKWNGVELWDITGKRTRAVPGPGDGASAFALSPDGKLFAFAGDYQDPNVYLHRADTGELVKLYTGHRRGVQSLAFSPDGRLLASGSRDTTVILWDIPDSR